ncbi:HupE/UreJ family protein [Pseudogemmobacter sonorensis]|uniref:HupE/UreJ family protein n=1 Tax=Pseudogemmobacter sonorensis TaxID=2989681 RepID=UPI0036C6FCB9
MNRIMLTLMLLLPTAALAHPGHGVEYSFLAGLTHPVGGLDHLLAMVAVGLCASVLGGRALWALPLAFVGGMVAGGLAGAAALPLPTVEPMILASIVVLGALTAAALNPSLPLVAAVTAAFGLFHGHAHGTEGPTGGLALYAIGFVLATAGLHLAGIALGRGLQRNLTRVAGGLTAIAGVALALG